ncbi:MAG: AraC family transcriptional regulator [Halopseudomonas aestusnigri]
MPINKAISYIEANLEQPLSLKEIADKSGLSPYYFSRLFRALTGESTMSYLRQRRLTEAARKLEMNNNISLINLAMDYGFDSQQAFTRAFKRTFGVPPGQYRTNGRSLRSKFQQPLKQPYFLDPGALPMKPTIRTKKTFNVIGMSKDFGESSSDNPVDLWGLVCTRIKEIKGVNKERAYGLCLKGSVENFTYMASFETNSISTVPKGMKSLTVDTAEYAVFTFTINDRSPIGDQFSAVYQGIWGNWLPNSKYNYAETPDFELYDHRFDGATDTGEVDIWIPIIKK